MKIPKHYFHDRTVLALIGVNTLLVLFLVLYVLLKIDPAQGTVRIIQVRKNITFGSYAGSINEFRTFALFALIQYVFGILLSIKLYVHRRHLSVAILSMATFLLILTFVVYKALEVVS